MALLRGRAVLAASLVTLAVSSTAHAQTEFAIAPASLDHIGSLVGFTIYGSAIFKIKREGQFKDFTGQVSYDPDHLSNTRVDLTVYTASVDMHNTDHDQMLRSADFFDVERYPTMHFVSSSVDPKADGSLMVTGDMTIRGITQRMTIPIALHHGSQPDTGAGAVFDTTFQIDRTQFGLNGAPDWGGFKVSISKNVQIHITIATSLHAPQIGR